MIKVKVRVFGDLIKLLGNEMVIELNEGSEINDLILEIAGKVPDFREKVKSLSSQQGITDFNFTILLNGANINLLNGPKTKLNDGDTVVFLPPAAGG